MSSLHRLYPGDAAVALALDVSVQIAGVVLAALVVGGTVARRNAALRHGVWLAALAWVCVSPAAAWGLRRAGVALWQLPAPAAHAERGAAARPGNPRPDSAAPRAADRAAPPEERATAAGAPLGARAVPPPVAPVRASEVVAARGTAVPSGGDLTPHPVGRAELFAGLAIAWAAGALLLLARLGRGLWIVARVRRSLEPADAVVGAVLPRVRQTLGGIDLPPIRLSPHVRGPATVGLWRPVVVLPPDLAAGMSESELHDALAHECGHAIRRDGLIALLQRAAGAVFWPHPMLHLLNRQLSRAREEVCDNLALRGTTPAGYARTLLSLAQRIGSASGVTCVGLLDGQWRLEHRVAGLLHSRRIVMTRMSKRAGVTVAIIAMALGAALAAVGTAAEQTQSARDVSPTTRPRGADSPKPAPDKAPAATTEPRLFTDKEAEFAQKLEQSRRDVRRAELDVQEAKLKLHGDEMTVQRLAANDGRTPSAELDRAKLAVEIDRIQLERAQLALEDVREKAESLLPPIRVSVAGPDYGGGGTFSLKGQRLTVTQVLSQQRSVDAAHADAIKVSLQRGYTAASQTVVFHDITLKDLLSGKVKDDIVQPGDSIWAKILAVAVLNATAEPNRFKIIWPGEQKLTLRQALSEVGIDLGTTGKSIYLTNAWDHRSRPGWNGTTTIRDNGPENAKLLERAMKLLDDVVEPGDRIEVK